GRTFATLDAGGDIRLQHSTTARTLLDVRCRGASQRALLFAPQGRRLSVVADAAALQAWTVFNPHPEASIAALVEPPSDEGYAQPREGWQSTGGSDGFGPKLSLVPLLWGRL